MEKSFMPKEDGVELRWLFMVIRRWWWLILGLGLLAGIIAFVATSWKPPVYQATATLLIQPSVSTRTNEYNALVAGERLALTYGQMLKGRPVLEEVISKLGLDETPGALADKMSVEPVKDTQLIRLTVTGSSPEQGAVLANAIAEAFIAQVKTLNAERYAGSMTSMHSRAETLSAQIDETQSKMDALSASKMEDEAELTRLENSLAEYRSDYRVLQQEYQSLQLTVVQLMDNTSVFEAAEVPDNPAQSSHTVTATLLIDQSLITGGASSSTFVASDRLAATYSQMLMGRPVLQEAITQLGLEENADALKARVKAEPIPETQLIRLSVTDTNPNQAALIANAIAEAFLSQTQSLLAQPYSDRLASLKQQIDEFSSLMEQSQSEIETLTASRVQEDAELTRLETLLTEYRTDYRTLQQNLEQADLSAADVADAVVVAEPARAPQGPAGHRMLYVLVAAAVGMAIGVAMAFLLEYLNDKIETLEDVSETLGLSTVGTIAQLTNGDSKLVMVAQPHSPVAEAFRVLATNVRFSSVNHPLRTLLVTSPNPQEGKSTTTANLAAAMAETGLRVVAVDADLRHPRLHKFFGLEARKGLTASLVEGNTDGNLQSSVVEGLRVLASGALPANPTWLTGSQRMRELLEELTEMADLVLIDSPPILHLADTAVLAQAVDGVLLVLLAGHTRTQDAQSAVKSLHQVGANLVGVVLNAAPIGKGSYYSYYTTGRPKPKNRLARWFQGMGARLAPHGKRQ
jgi:succinoglycan biosynthesis transport protein ExoP